MGQKHYLCPSLSVCLFIQMNSFAFSFARHAMNDELGVQLLFLVFCKSISSSRTETYLLNMYCIVLRVDQIRWDCCCLWLNEKLILSILLLQTLSLCSFLPCHFSSHFLLYIMVYYVVLCLRRKFFFYFLFHHPVNLILPKSTEGVFMCLPST